MKNKIKYGLSIASIFMICSISKSQTGFSITVKLEGMIGTKKVNLLTVSEKALGPEKYRLTDTVATTSLKDGLFNFLGETSSYGKLYAISIEGSKNFYMLLSNGDQVIINGKYQEWPMAQVSGSTGTIDWYEYKRKFDKLKVLGNEEQVNIFRRDFIRDHPNSVYSAYVILRNQDMTIAERQVEYKKLTPYAKASFFGMQILPAIRSGEVIDPIKSGYIIPDFSITMADGNIRSIRKIVSKNKLTLIDLWASWCVACREETPNLKKVYSVFRNKGFGILAVSTDEKEIAWKKAMKEENTPWPNGRDNVRNAWSELFLLRAIPGLILVDEKGKMISFHGMSDFPEFGPRIRGKELHKTIADLL